MSAAKGPRRSKESISLFLGFYGTDQTPEALSAELGCEPSWVKHVGFETLVGIPLEHHVWALESPLDRSPIRAHLDWLDERVGGVVAALALAARAGWVPLLNLHWRGTMTLPTLTVADMERLAGWGLDLHVWQRAP